MKTALKPSPVAALLADLLRGGVVDAADLALVLGATPRSVARWRAGTVLPRRAVEERLLELAAVLDAVRARAVEAETARLWLRRPHRELGYDRPLDRIAAGGFRDLIAVLEP